MDALSGTFPDWEQMIRAEQAWAASMFDDALDLPGGLSLFTSGSGGNATRPPDNGWSRLFSRLRRLYVPDRAMKKHFSDHFDALIAATRNEDGRVGMNLDETALFARIPAWNVLGRIILPSLSRSHELTLRARSNFVRARTALAAAAYRRDRGQDPPSLSALAPDYLAEVPIDPMTGHELEPVRDAPATAPGGIVLVTREMEPGLRAKRTKPVTGRPRKSRWRLYADRFGARYVLTPEQVASVDAIVRDMETRAARFERSRAEAIEKLSAAGQYGRLADELAPLNAMFDHLRRRLNAVPTAEQRAGAERKRKPANDEGGR